MATADDRVAIDEVLDEFHEAAAEADEDRYFETLSPHAVFLGTAPGDRWAGDELRAFVHGYFSRGKGWTYVPSRRSVDVSPGDGWAWFDETVTNEHYGECRGTGTLRRVDGEWRIVQYNLTIPIPDAIAPDVVTMIREQTGR